MQVQNINGSWRRGYTLMSVGWFLLLGLLLPLLRNLGRLTAADLGFWLVSLVVCLVVLVLVQIRAKLATVNRVMLISISLWTFSRLLMDIIVLNSVRPATVVMVDALVAIAFAFLSLRSAVIFTAGSGLALLLGSLGQARTDWELLIFNLFTLAVIGYMSVYGQQIRAARLRAERVEMALEYDEETGLYTPQAARVLLEARAVQADSRQQQVGVMLVRPLNLPWIEAQMSGKPAQHAFVLMAERLQGICDKRDMVALWEGQSFIVGVRNVNAAQLKTRVQALQRALHGVYWVFGPVIRVEVVAALIADAENLEAELSALSRRSELN